jgi:hypothetical protein
MTAECVTPDRLSNDWRLHLIAECFREKRIRLQDPVSLFSPPKNRCILFLEFL